MPLPELMRQVWLWYDDVRSGEKLTCAELLAWTTLTGIQPERFELSLIRELDEIYWQMYYDRNREANS